MCSTEIDRGWTSWPTQINAVLWTEKKLNITFLPRLSTRTFPLCDQHGAFQIFIHGRYGLKAVSSEQRPSWSARSPGLCVCQMCTTACRVFAEKLKFAVFCGMHVRLMSSSFPKFVLGFARLVLRKDLENTLSLSLSLSGLGWAVGVCTLVG